MISVSVLPCKTGNTEITSFHLNIMFRFANKAVTDLTLRPRFATCWHCIRLQC